MVARSRAEADCLMRVVGRAQRSDGVSEAGVKVVLTLAKAAKDTREFNWRRTVASRGEPRLKSGAHASSSDG